jgi:hypothetical protein
VHFVFGITTPASTSYASRKKTVLPMARGKITRLDLQFPPGVQALAHIVLTRGLHQLFPTNPEGDYASSAETIWWPENEDLAQPPFQLEAYTWNLDTTYPHTITVRITLEPITPATTLWEEVKQLFAAQPEVTSA